MYFFFTLQLVLDLSFVCYLENSSSGYTACVFSSISFWFFLPLELFFEIQHNIEQNINISTYDMKDKCLKNNDMI